MVINKIPNQIINGTLSPLKLSNIDTIALHHMAHPTADVKMVEKWHTDQDWSAIGYNFFVAFDGTIYEGRGFNKGAGVANHNGHVISIGFQGDYHSKPTQMPDAQFNAGIDVINYVMSKLPNKVSVKGHRDFGGSVCPGVYFPFDEMVSLQKRGEVKEVPQENIYNWTTACPQWSIPYVQKALDLKWIIGNEKGELQLTDDKIWTLVVLLRSHGIME